MLSGRGLHRTLMMRTLLGLIRKMQSGSQEVEITSSRVHVKPGIQDNMIEPIWAQFHDSAYRKHRIGPYGSRELCADGKRV